MNESFVFYRSFAKAMKKMPAEACKELLMMICDYALDGVAPDEDCDVECMFELIRPQIDANNKRREAGRKGGEANGSKAKQTEANGSKAKQTEANGSKAKQTEANVNANVNVNDNEKEKDSKESKKKSQAFHAPSIEEVREYCEERGNNISPEQFVDFYTANGWMVGKHKMKDWKACMRTWEQRESRAAPKSEGWM